MVLGAPAWSDVCAAFMHGYPRRLVSTDHGGFLRGNVIVAAKVSKRALRSLAPANIAAFSSRRTLRNLGLTASELLLARQSAISHTGQQRLPHRLVQTMLRFGVDFLTFAPLSRDTLEKLSDLAQSVTQRNLELCPDAMDAEQAEASSSSDTGYGDELIELDSSTVVSRLTQTELADVQTNSHSLQLALFTNFVAGSNSGAAAPTDEQDRQPGEEQDCDSAQRDATRSASQKSASGGAARSGNSGPTASSSDQQPEQPMAADGTRPVPDTAVPSEEILRQRLLQIPRVDTIHVPKASTLVSLRDFLSKHVPLGPHVSR